MLKDVSKIGDRKSTKLAQQQLHSVHFVLDKNR